MPQQFTVENQVTGQLLATFDSTGNLILAGKLTQAGVVSGGQLITPPGTAAGALAAQNNLSDLTDKAAARTNLGVSSTAGSTFPLSAYGLLAASGDPNEFQRPGGVSSNDRFFVRIFVPAGVPINEMWCAVTTAGTWDGATGPNQLVLYDDTAAQVTTTPDTGTTWTSNGWRGGAVAAPQAAQATDRYVYGMAIFRGMTVGPVIAFPVSGTDNAPWFATGPAGSGATHRRGIYTAGTTVPASFDPTSFGAATSFIPLIGIK